MGKILFFDDFSEFPAGNYPSNYYATQEYHYLPQAGFKGNWYESTISHMWRPCNAAWIFVEDNGKKRLLSTLESSVPFNRILITGNELWADYSIKACIQILNVSGYAGIVFRYQNNREYYALIFENGEKLKLIKANHEEISILNQADYKYSNIDKFELEIIANSSKLMVLINNKNLFSAEDDSYKNGRLGFISLTTCFFDYIKVSANENSYNIFVDLKDKREKELEEIRQSYPKPELWKKISTKGFGAGRQLRFGHLREKKDNLDILIAQNIKLQPEKDDYSAVRALTAIDLDGNILWQFGEAQDSFEAAITTCDLPVQIYDIDNDGYDEVICVKNFKLYILNGQTGKIKTYCDLPNSVSDEKRYGFLNADAVIIGNISGNKKPQDIIIKNRYHQFWVLDDKLNLLWTAKRPNGKNKANIGHFPSCYDFDGKGKDDIFAGYTLFDSQGKVKWNHDWPDHTDEIIIGAFNPKLSGVQIATVSGDEGFCIFDPYSGKVLHKELLGHAQRISAAKFRVDLEGLQFYIVTFWHYTGIISFHDCTGEKLFSFEPAFLGNILNPVNWTGEGTELALLNTNAVNGGMIDGYGRIVVLFPDDGHPDLCCEAINITGDPRSEIVTWDMESIWIYTQNKKFTGKKIYTPIHLPHYNNSNYRGEISLPGWKELK